MATTKDLVVKIEFDEELKTAITGLSQKVADLERRLRTIEGRVDMLH